MSVHMSLRMVVVAGLSDQEVHNLASGQIAGRTGKKPPKKATQEGLERLQAHTTTQKHRMTATEDVR